MDWGEFRVLFAHKESEALAVARRGRVMKDSGAHPTMRQSVARRLVGFLLARARRRAAA